MRELYPDATILRPRFRPASTRPLGTPTRAVGHSHHAPVAHSPSPRAKGLESSARAISWRWRPWGRWAGPRCCTCARNGPDTKRLRCCSATRWKGVDWKGRAPALDGRSGYAKARLRGARGRGCGGLVRGTCAVGKACGGGVRATRGAAGAEARLKRVLRGPRHVLQLGGLPQRRLAPAWCCRVGSRGQHGPGYAAAGAQARAGCDGVMSSRAGTLSLSRSLS